MKKTIWLVLCAVLIISCSKNDNDSINEGNLYEFEGAWVIEEYNRDAIVAVKSDDFSDDKAGIKFAGDGSFIHRSNAGDCGTPPITYANYQGTWTLFPDNTLFIETEYWGGATSYTIEIIEVNSEKLVYRNLKTEK